MLSKEDYETVTSTFRSMAEWLRGQDLKEYRETGHYGSRKAALLVTAIELSVALRRNDPDLDVDEFMSASGVRD